jgi:hypothetical protein
MAEDQPRIVRKRLLERETSPRAERGTIDLREVATLVYSSEAPEYPVEAVIDGHCGRGGTRWLAAEPDQPATLMVEFDQPQKITRLVYEVEETSAERTQQMRIEASTDGGQTYQMVLVQEYTFSPQGATFERQDLRLLDWREVTHLRFIITPNQQGSGTATLTCLELFY